MSLIKIIRSAIINNTVRTYQFNEIADMACCSRSTAKQLYFSFLYQATEDYLTDLRDNAEK